jgi:Golgi SNAP receptor complex protein 2
LKRTFDAWKLRQREEQERKERESLLSAPPQSNNVGGVPIADYYVREGDALQRTEAHIDDYISMGRNALQELYDQKSILKVCFSCIINVYSRRNGGYWTLPINLD